MDQKVSAPSSSVAEYEFTRSRSAVIRREKDGQALKQFQISWGSAQQPNSQRTKCSIATDTLNVCAIDLRRKWRKKSAILFSMANPSSDSHTSRIFRFASLKAKA